MRSRFGDRRHAPRGPHHERLGQPFLGTTSRERLEVARECRPEVGVDRRRRSTLVFAELGRELVRGDDARPRKSLAQLVGDGFLVPPILEREQETDGNCLGIDLGQRLEVERPQNPVGPDSLVDLVAPLERNERRGMVLAEPVEVGARLPAEVEQMREPGRPDERRFRALALEERIRRHRRSVRESLQLAGADGVRGREHRLLLARRGRDLGRRDPSVLDEDGVREGPADVDAENAHAMNADS